MDRIDELFGSKSNRNLPNEKLRISCFLFLYKWKWKRISTVKTNTIICCLLFSTNMKNRFTKYTTREKLYITRTKQSTKTRANEKESSIYKHNKPIEHICARRSEEYEAIQGNKRIINILHNNVHFLATNLLRKCIPFPLRKITADRQVAIRARCWSPEAFPFRARINWTPFRHNISPMFCRETSNVVIPIG